MKHKKQTKPKPILIKLQGSCKVRLEHELIITILKEKGIDAYKYNKLYLDQKIKLCELHITIDDVTNHATKIYGW